MNKTLEAKNLKIAIQKSGRLTEDSLATLEHMGLQIETYGRRLFATCRNFPVEILFCRDDDIPGYVDSGIADVGIVGQNIVAESCLNLVELSKPGFGFCRMTVAVPKKSDYRMLEDLNEKTIATSFPNFTKKVFTDLGIKIKVVQIAGAVEITPSLGVADAILDVMSTGSTMMLNDLRPLQVVLESEAVIVRGSKQLTKLKQQILEQLLTRMQGVLNAKNLKYVMMNAPRDSLEEIKMLTPGLNAPTVIELARDGWIAVHTVINESEFWKVVSRLKQLGAEGLLVLPIEKIVP